MERDAVSDLSMLGSAEANVLLSASCILKEEQAFNREL